MRRIVAVLVFGATALSGDGCVLFGAAVPCASAANCPGTEVCVEGFCTADAGEQVVGRCGDASRAVVDASLEADDDSTRHYRSIRAAVEALADAQVTAPCIDVLGGTYREGTLITLSPGTILKGANPFQRGTPQIVIFSRRDDGAFGFAVSDAVIDGLRIEGNGNVIVPDGVDADVRFELVQSVVAGGGGIVLVTSGSLELKIDDSEMLQGALHVDAPDADVGIVASTFDRTRIDITQGFGLAITETQIFNHATGLLLSTANTQLFNVDLKPFPSAPGCSAGLVVGGGAIAFQDVDIEGLPCPAVILRDEIAQITNVSFAPRSGRGLRFKSNTSRDLVVKLSPRSAGLALDASDVEWSTTPECGAAACTCTAGVEITIGEDEVCTETCAGGVCT